MHITFYEFMFGLNLKIRDERVVPCYIHLIEKFSAFVYSDNKIRILLGVLKHLGLNLMINFASMC